MERNDLTDDLDRRLRAARPTAARVDEHAFDGALLARVRQQPIAARRSGPRSIAMPVAAGAIVVATAAVVLGSIPGNVGGPSSAAAITQQTLHWLDPSPGTILHIRSIETSGAQTTTREYWQSADDPRVERELIQGSQTFEASGDSIYDPATDTIYDPFTTPADTGKPAAGPKVGSLEHPPAGKAAADEAAVDKAAATPQPTRKAGGDPLAAGDPIIAKVRMLLEDGRMSVTGRELHDGVDAWQIALVGDAGRPSWKLWVSTDDGKPLELRDPGRDAHEPGQVIRWSTYEVLPDDGSTQPLLTLAGAHPSATVTHDPAQADAAGQRLGVEQSR